LREPLQRGLKDVGDLRQFRLTRYVPLLFIGERGL